MLSSIPRLHEKGLCPLPKNFVDAGEDVAPLRFKSFEDQWSTARANLRRGRMSYPHETSKFGCKTSNTQSDTHTKKENRQYEYKHFTNLALLGLHLLVETQTIKNAPRTSFGQFLFQLVYSFVDFLEPIFR